MKSDGRKYEIDHVEKNEVDRDKERSWHVVRSRIWLDISYDALVRGLMLPPYLRVVQVKSNDEAAIVSVLVEGVGDRYKYSWRPGCAIVHMVVNPGDDLLDRLLNK